MPILRKKLQVDCLRGQVSHVVRQNPSSRALSDCLIQSGYSRTQTSDYVPIGKTHLEELFVRLEDDDRPFVKITVFNTPIIGLLDSGAHRSILGVGSLKLIKSCKLRLFPAEVDLVTASGQKLDVTGYVNLPISFNGQTKLIATLVVPELKRRLLLGTDFWKAFGIVPTVQSVAVEELHYSPDVRPLTEEQLQDLDSIKKLFKVAVDGQLDTTPLISHRIELTDEAKQLAPVRINPFPNSPKRQEQINKELDSMLEAGIIERSYSNWALRLVPVDKPDETVRLCLDARKLNERTVRDSYPLPHADRILSRVGPCRYISTIDLSKAFLQIPLHPKSRKFTAFSVLGRGLFQFTRMPFGLVNSPATLSRLMDRVLGAGELEPHVFVYLDDIIVVSETFEQHVQLLREVASRLNRANLSINIQKSKFCLSELPYLGYILTNQGLKPNPDRVEAIINIERPNSIRALRRFLGMCNYYRRFIASYSDVVRPLTDLLKDKPKSIRWNESAEASFVRIKELLISSPLLASPDFSKPFCIHCDASDTAIAGVLTQERDGAEQPIAYYSQKLTGPEQRYFATEKEALAVLKSIEKFRCYVEGSKFTVITDASALTYILRSSWRTSSRLCRWSIELQRHDMVIKHRRGIDNVVPDTLSRAVEVLALDRQGTDWYSKLMKNVQEEPEKYKDFRLENGVLRKLVSTQGDTLDYHFEWKTCVPKEMRENVLVEEHDDALHLGTDKTIAKIKKKYYWPNLANDVRSHIRKCSVCHESKPANHSQHPTVGSPRLASKPFQIIAVDFIQSLPRSKAGNAHLFVVMDVFSKFCLLVPVRQITAPKVCEILENHWFLRYSTPEFLISDNASTFLSTHFQDLLQRFHVQHWTNPRHHSQSNPVERLNRTINACIRTYARSDQKLWDTKVPDIECALNTSPHGATGYSPYRILFGHEIVGLGDEHRIDRDTEDLSDGERVERKLQIDRSVYELVHKNLQKQFNKNSQSYNLRHKTFAPTYSAGQKVYKRNFRQSSAPNSYNAKLGPCYLPCTVVARIGTSSYELADESGKCIGVFSAADLKPRES